MLMILFISLELFSQSYSLGYTKYEVHTFHDEQASHTSENNPHACSSIQDRSPQDRTYQDESDVASALEFDFSFLGWA